MTASVKMPVLNEVQVIDRTLDILMDEIIAIDAGQRNPRNLPPHPGAQSIAQIADEYRWDQKTTNAERFVLKLKYDPVREALTHAVRQIGKRLHEIGGMPAMREALEKQEDRPSGYRRICILDHRWDGIGEWVA
jgi:hypothetical protein